MISPVKTYQVPQAQDEISNAVPFLKSSAHELLEVYFYIALPLLALIPVLAISSLQGSYLGKIIWYALQSPALLGIWRVMASQVRREETEISDYFYYFKKEQFLRYWPLYYLPHLPALLINFLLSFFDGGFFANFFAVTLASVLEITILILQIRVVFYSKLSNQTEIINWFKSEDFQKKYFPAFGLHDLRIIFLILLVALLGILLVIFPFLFISLPFSFILLHQHLEAQRRLIESTSQVIP